MVMTINPTAKAAPRLVYLVTEDWYFLSHRLPMAKAAQQAGYEVHVLTNLTGHERAIAELGFEVHPVRWRRGSMSPFGLLTMIRAIRRLYRALAEMAVMLSATRAGEPDRLMVQSPAANLDATEPQIARYAAEWGFPADAVAGWRAGAARRTSSDRDYSTLVFTADDVGFAHLEFQVSHHVRERVFVIAAMFSWLSPPTNRS